jgi:hypothetical protein
MTNYTPAHTAAEFERCWRWIEPALDVGAYVHNGKIWHLHRKEDILARVLDGRAALWGGGDSAIVSEIVRHPTGLRSHNTWLSGGDIDEIKAMTISVEDYGREHGCHRQTGYGRFGWIKVLDGYVATGIRRQKDLVRD